MGMGGPSTGNMEVTFSDMLRGLQSEAYEYIHGKAGGAGRVTWSDTWWEEVPFLWALLDPLVKQGRDIWQMGTEDLRLGS